ncbi:dipeptidyl aminopeptidase/acylaminoacyl peptidase [Cecembia rubra]|uniref:Acyl-peptide hydrolase n=2 Tax=Cecembia rubra TaxID=1485585 RepID=A0A2P8ECP4_9BACT|nr:dipeptidyl aminopeptidase/acylaminoacyl peptidase [Cecembia rubra]
MDMKKVKLSIFIFLLGFNLFAQSFTMEQVTSFPFPSELTASNSKDWIAWAMNEKGLRNIYLAQAPHFDTKKVTNFSVDDGQEISSLQFTPDGNNLIFVRGGEHGSNWDWNVGINPSQSTFMPKVEIWKLALVNGKVEMITEGDEPIVSPDSKTVAYIKNRQVWTFDLNDPKPAQLFEIKGSVANLSWSPSGDLLLFIVNRGTHSMVAVFDLREKSLRYLSPSFSRDTSPRWSPDGRKVTFIRRPGGKPEPQPILEQRHNPWEIWTADIQTTEGKMRWKAPETLRGSISTTHGGANLHWAADNQLIYLSYEDGWPHLYAMDAEAGLSRQLTKGNFMVEHVLLTPDKKSLLFTANTGPLKDDIDRRHIGRVDILSGKMDIWSQGESIETNPVILSGNQFLACISSNSKRPMLPTILSLETGQMKVIGESILPPDFPLEQMLTPKQVIFKSPDGLNIHAQIFEKEGGEGKKPAVLFVHGGPQRQMLLGWHYGDYYSNTYAINQYLANMGFVVLSVNFRLGIGYGHEFHKPERTYWQGAEEYLDVKAAGEYLASLPQVDDQRIGIYGGSYGGYLTALALAKDSGLFKVGVDIHGVHELSSRLEMPEGFEKAPDFEKAQKTAFYSSPLAYLDTWTSPVLFIHGDDDRNVQVSQTVDLIRRFEERKMPFEYLIIPDDSHHWMKYANLVKVNTATVDFLQKHLKP